MTYRVRDIDTGRIEPGLPSPFLIEQGGGEAYQSPDMGDYWYAKARGYESADGTYTRVRVERTEDWKVTLSITAIETGTGERDTYDDWFIVDAATEQEAGDLAVEKGREDVEQRYGVEFATDISILRTVKGSW